jgi:cation transport ATPase
MARYGDYGTARQRDEYGGINWGASFFGWLVAVGIGALLTALLSAAGAAIAISEIENADEAVASADTVGIVGGLLILVVALLAYFAGGYVAGRMSRFDGGRQGVGVWIWSIVVAIVLAILGAIAGSEWNLFGDLELPRIPVDEGDLTTGGVIVLILVLIGTLLAAMAGGKAGERYHRRVDELGHRPLAGREDRESVAEEVREERAERRARRDPDDTRTAHS